MKFKKYNFEKVISTNNTAINIIKKTNINKGMIISKNQKKGKGQYGRKWISFKGNLFVSFFYNIDNINIKIKNLSKINRNLVKKTISFYYKKKNISFKEPNDILINKKKICGILQETITINNKKFLIVGIGMNIIKSPNIKNYATTSLMEITGKKFSYKFIANSLKANFDKKFYNI